MSKILIYPVAFVLFVCFPASGMGSIVTLQAGNQDGFAGPADPVSPSNALRAAYRARHGQGVISFDVFTPNRGVAHTFVDLPTNIVDATLEFRLKGMNDINTPNDFMTLLFVDAATPTWNEARTWEYGLAGLKQKLGLGSGWGTREDRTFVLSLRSLASGDPDSTGLIPQLNQHRFLDVVIIDDTAVDYMKLTLETQPIPEPSTFVCWSGLLLAGVAAGRLQRRKRKAMNGISTRSVVTMPEA